jgi:hypothetical protein
VTGAVKQVDWDDVERRSRRREPLGFLVLIAVMVSWMALTGRFVATGTVGWIAVGLYACLFVGLLVAQRSVPRLRATAAAGYRVMHALRHHVDPGPELRERADRHARYVAELWIRWWMVVPLVALPLMTARWDRPLVAVPSAAVLLTAVGVFSRSLQRHRQSALHWVADPPGPARSMPELRRWERWATSRRFALVLAGVLIVTIAAGTVLVILAD